MIPDEAPLSSPPPIGHNSGTMFATAKAEQAEALHDTVRDGRTFSQRKAEFLASAAAQRVTDRQSAADAADTIKMAREVWEMIDADRRKRSDPFRETHLTLSAMASEFWAPVVDAMGGLNEQIDTFTAADDARIAARKAEQQREMASWRGDPAPSAPVGREHLDYSAPAERDSVPAPRAPVRPAQKRAPIRGDLGARISQRDVVTYEIEDISLIPDHIMQSDTVKAAILTVVKSTARHMGVPAGIRVHRGTGNTIS